MSLEKINLTSIPKFFQHKLQKADSNKDNHIEEAEATQAMKAIGFHDEQMNDQQAFRLFTEIIEHTADINDIFGVNEDRHSKYFRGLIGMSLEAQEYDETIRLADIFINNLERVSKYLSEVDKNYILVEVGIAKLKAQMALDTDLHTVTSTFEQLLVNANYEQLLSSESVQFPFSLVETQYNLYLYDADDEKRKEYLTRAMNSIAKFSNYDNKDFYNNSESVLLLAKDFLLSDKQSDLKDLVDKYIVNE